MKKVTNRSSSVIFLMDNLFKQRISMKPQEQIQLTEKQFKEYSNCLENLENLEYIEVETFDERAAAKAELDATKEELNIAKEELNVTKRNLDATKKDLEDVASELDKDSGVSKTGYKKLIDGK